MDLRCDFQRPRSRLCVLGVNFLGLRHTIVTDNHLEPPLEKVNKEVVFRNPTVRTLLNKSTLRTLPHLEPSLTIIYNIYIIYIICIYIYVRFWESGVRGKLMPGHHQDAEYSPNPIYIYIRNRTVRTPPTISVFFAKSMKYLYLSTYAGAPSRC